MIIIPLHPSAVITYVSPSNAKSPDPGVLDLGESILLPAGSTVVVSGSHEGQSYTAFNIEVVNDPMLFRLSLRNRFQNILQIV